MITEKLLSQDLVALQQEKGNTCISIIIPTHRRNPERRLDRKEIEKVIARAVEALGEREPEASRKILLESLDQLAQTIDFNHQTEGIGLYVSSHIKILIHFPFPVEEKLIIGDHFELRDLLYKVNLSKPYLVLQISEKDSHLYEGSVDELLEVRDAHFPAVYNDQYEYNPASQSSTMAGYAHVKSNEKDKSVMEEIRFKQFFHQIDKKLNEYLQGDKGIVLLGAEKELSWFENQTRHANRIFHKIAGNYNHLNHKEIADLVWPHVRKHLLEEQAQSIREFQEKVGQKHAISGIQEVWKASREGNASKLLVEKDFHKPGFVEADTEHLFLQPPRVAHQATPDAVEDIIEMVLKKKGQVLFMENDGLKDFQHIALITRY